MSSALSNLLRVVACAGCGVHAPVDAVHPQVADTADAATATGPCPARRVCHCWCRALEATGKPASRRRRPRLPPCRTVQRAVVRVSLRRPSRGGRRSLGGQHRRAPGVDRVVVSTSTHLQFIAIGLQLTMPAPSCELWLARACRHHMCAKPLCLPVQAEDARRKVCPGCCHEERWQQRCAEANS